MKPLHVRVACSAATVLVAGCAPGGNSQPANTTSAAAAQPAPAAAPNTLTAGEKAAGWRLLFDGTSMNAWRGYRSETVPTGWMAMDGTIMKEGGVGDIVSREQFGDFEWSIDWRIGERGNSGLFYRGTEEYDHIYWSAPEYQLLDDIKASDNKDTTHLAGSIYGFYAPPMSMRQLPGNVWNTTRIVAKGPHIEHWLNGVKVGEAEIGSAEWNAKLKASKFAVWPNFAKSPRGYLAVQGDHPGRLELRNIKIRELK